MKLDDLLLMDFTGKTVVIGGYPGTGKTHIAEKLYEKHPGSKIIHTDDYKEHGFKESLYELMKNIPPKEKTLFIEGVLFARLLRKGQELSSFYPDVVIIVERDEESIFDYYIEKGEGHKISDVSSFFKNLDTVYGKYLNSIIIKEPEFITVYNNDF
jgi:deoxyadenosine/deoxycytidine kinase